MIKRISRSPDSIVQGTLRRTFRTIQPHLGHHRALIGGGIAALFAEVVLAVLEPWPVKIVVDSITAGLGADLRAEQRSPEQTATVLVACGAVMVGLITLRALTNYAGTVMFALAGSRVATALRAQAFDHVQALSLRYHAVASAEDTLQRLIGDIGRLREVAVTAGLPLARNVMTLVLVTGIMAWLNPLLTLVVAGASMMCIVVSRSSARAITAAARGRQRGEGALAAAASDSIGAIRLVQAYGLERTFARAFSRGNQAAVTDSVQATRLAAALAVRSNVIVGVTTAIVLAGAGWWVVEGRMTPGDLVLFLLYLGIAMRPLGNLAKYTARITRAAASAERVADLLDERVEVADRPEAQRMLPARGEILLTDVSVEDDRGQLIFDRVRLAIPAGQNVCVLGPSEAGKATLVGLILRTIDPVAGEVSVDGIDVRDVSLASLRWQVSILLRDSALFATTVRENIRFGRLAAAEEEVEDAARRANAHDFITDLPEGYDTVLGSGGMPLTGGQRQRIAIARAVLRNAPIVILDDVTLDLDPAAWAVVDEPLQRLTRDRTTITITHDSPSVSRADRVLWLEQGRIVEDGSPAQLLSLPDSRLSRWMAGPHEWAATP